MGDEIVCEARAPSGAMAHAARRDDRARAPGDGSVPAVGRAPHCIAGGLLDSHSARRPEDSLNLYLSTPQDFTCCAQLLVGQFGEL